ncbi:MAG: DUF4293 domain-containing protein [Flavobacteriales bacterium]|nr:DUF4293 domain-containing protein [Flavobacteriales bacterium]
MLQRIQTVYLLLAVISLVVVFFVDIAHFADAAGIESELSLYKITNGNGEIGKVEYGMLPVALIAVTAAILFATILQYRNRNVQSKIIRMCYVLLLLCVVAIWYFTDQNYWSLEIAEPQFSYSIGFFMPFVAFAFTFLASRGIRKDEQLVKSLDRIR